MRVYCKKGVIGGYSVEFVCVDFITRLCWKWEDKKIAKLKKKRY